MGLDRRLLVTGAGGQLGKALAKLEPDAVSLDRAHLDITDERQVAETIAREQPEVIVNAAAYTKVDAAEADPERALAVNARGVDLLADAANRAGALLVTVSTDYVFAGDKPAPYLETDPTGPLSVYGKSKLEGERAAARADHHLIVRSSWVFGEGANFIASILAAASTRDELSVVDDQRGLPTYASDLADGILMLIEKGAGGVIHLAGGGEAAVWADVAEVALQTAGAKARVRRVSTADYYAGRTGPVAPRPANSVLDCSKAAALGVALRPWKDAVAEYVRGLA